jgi:hypothetical protein
LVATGNPTNNNVSPFAPNQVTQSRITSQAEQGGVSGTLINTGSGGAFQATVPGDFWAQWKFLNAQNPLYVNGFISQISP